MFQNAPHYIALAKYAKVLCVEPPITIFDVVFNPGRVWKQRRKIKNSLLRVNENLFVYTPLAVGPFRLSYRIRLLSRLNKFFITRGLENQIDRLQIKRHVSISYTPQQSYLIGILNPLVCIYDVADELSVSEKCPDLNKLGFTGRAIEREEKKVLSRVDIVFATSKKLYERKRRYNKNTYFVPNGVDLDHFWNSSDKRVPEMLDIPRPRIGYTGHISTYLNFEWLDYSARKHHEWSFVFLGIFDNQRIINRDPHYQQFIKRKNVHMLGWKRYEDLPAYMKEIDVFILPRRDCDWCQNSNPNKLYQYLSTGKPVVSSRFSSVEPFEGPILIADDKISFLKHLEKAICDNNGALREQRMKLAQQNDLTLRAGEKIDIINRFLAEKKVI
jgi:glycosyltransferase involved in cell wall biosynthesis